MTFTQQCARPCRSYLLCGAGAWVLGFLTGLCGPRMIAATTVAIERVVLRHLEHQLVFLRDVDPAAVEAINAIASDERLHHDRSAARLGAPDWRARLLGGVVAASTEAVIWLGMRL